MLDEKKINEIKKNAENLIKDGTLAKGGDGKEVKFFIDNSRNSFNSAKLLFEVSTNTQLKNLTGFQDFDGFLWVINSSYYSMFYMARALLESEGITVKTNESSIHFIVFNALVYYFHLTKKLEKGFIEEFRDAEIESSELLGKQKAKELVEDYFFEKEKRGRFTYEMGEIAIQGKAQTSLERAKKFNERIRKLLEAKK